MTYTTTTSPGRVVDRDSYAAAILRYAGLNAVDVPRAVQGGPAMVSTAEALAEVQRRGITLEMPEPLPTPSRKRARAYVDPMLDLGACLIRVAPGRKSPVQDNWTHLPSLTRDEAVDWLMRDGNLGVNLGRSGKRGWASLDAENGFTAQALLALDLGLVPTTVTAASQDPTSPKFGGMHAICPLPEDIDRDTLVAKLGETVAGTPFQLDALVNGRHCVAPGSRIHAVPGYRYTFAAGGAWRDHSVFTPEPMLPFLDPAFPMPEGPFSDKLSGIFRKQARAARPIDPNADAITQQVDAVGWDDWLDGLEHLIQIVGVDASCGCEVFHYTRSSTLRSGILHDCDAYGSGVHVFSGTLAGEWGREHGSRLDFVRFLTGRSTSELARRFGINLGRELQGIDVEGLHAYRENTQFQVITGGGETAPPAEQSPRPMLSSVPPIANVGASMPTIGATALNAESAPPGFFTPEPDPLESLGADHSEEKSESSMFDQLDEIDASGFWDSLPILRRIADESDSYGVCRWGALGGALPRIVCTVPHDVRLLPASGKPGGPASGTSINLFSILTGAPEGGKSETIKFVDDLIPLPDTVSVIPAGTGEGIIKTYGVTRQLKTSRDAAHTEPIEPAALPGGSAAPPMPVGSVAGNGGATLPGYEFVRFTYSALMVDAEITNFIAEMNRRGTKTSGVIRSMYVGEGAGTTTGDMDRRTNLKSHDYRFGIILGAQVDCKVLGPFFREDAVGTPQRFLILPARATLPNKRPFTPISLPVIDWYGGNPVAAQVAGLVGSRDPVWIEPPPMARAAIDAYRVEKMKRDYEAYSASAARRRAEEEAEEGGEFTGPKGHELLMQLKIMAALSIGDGHRQPTDRHWIAAGIIMRARQIVIDAIIKTLNELSLIDRDRAGRGRGTENAAAKRAEKRDNQEFAARVANRIVRAIREAGGALTAGSIKSKVGNLYRSAVDEVLDAMRDEGIIYEAGFNQRGNKVYALVYG